MYNTILVPLDGSKLAERILSHVEGLARCYNSTIVFLQVVRPPSFEGASENGYDRISKKNLEEMYRADSYLKGIEGEFREKGMKTQTRVKCGPIVRTITDTAASVGADLIAISSHGRTGLPRVFYGSVAAGLLHRVDRPLLVIRSRG